MSKDQNVFNELCHTARKLGTSASGTLAKKLCSDYVNAHEKDFKKPEMRDSKELYKTLMSGLE